MLTDCGAEKTQESAPVEATFQRCFLSELQIGPLTHVDSITPFVEVWHDVQIGFGQPEYARDQCHGFYLMVTCSVEGEFSLCSTPARL